MKRVPLYIGHLCLVVSTSSLRKLEYKFSLNELTKVFGMQFLMDLALLNMLFIISRLISLGLNGQKRKEGVLNMIAPQRTFSHLH